MATLTIRLIKSFEYRTTKNLILRDVDLNWKVSELKQLILSKLATEAGFRPFINVQFDTLKLYVKAHGTKSQNLIINIDDEGYMDDDETLAALGVGKV
jgi:uncharacterized protein YihD (DUF1040 family)